MSTPKKIARRIREWDGGRVVLWHLDPPLNAPSWGDVSMDLNELLGLTDVEIEERTERFLATEPPIKAYSQVVTSTPSQRPRLNVASECYLLGANDGEPDEVLKVHVGTLDHDQVIRDAGYTIQGGDV